MALKYFGTDGIRGEYGGSTLNDEIAYRAGVAVARLLKLNHRTDAPLMIVGRDTRASGVNLLAALSAGFSSEGGTVESIGIAPTPAIARVVANGDALAGCSITASHNPGKDNGLKFFQSEGTKPTETFESALDRGVDKTKNVRALSYPAIEDTAACKAEEYVTQVKEAFDPNFLVGKKIALDCANGALSSIAVGIFESFGAEVDCVGCSPDGVNVNAGVGSECPQSITSMYLLNDYDLGFAFDGDGDRMVAFDNRGVRLSGESVLGLLAIRMKGKRKLNREVLVTTLQSNLGLDAALSQFGISVKRVGVGDKFVSRLMIAEDLSLGGEESGHVVYGDFSMTGDGLFAALKVAEAAVETGQALEELASFYKPFPQETRAIAVSSKPPIENCPTINLVAGQLKKSIGSQGRLYIRYSGTEPKIRLLVEANTNELAADAIRRLEEAVGKDLCE